MKVPEPSKLPKLCCQVNPQIRCSFCKEVLCYECGKAWSKVRHFIIDMCRRRFTKQQLKEATKCYSERKAKQDRNSTKINGGIVAPPLTAGACQVCTIKRATNHNDRETYALGVMK